MVSGLTFVVAGYIAMRFGDRLADNGYTNGELVVVSLAGVALYALGIAVALVGLFA